MFLTSIRLSCNKVRRFPTKQCLWQCLLSDLFVVLFTLIKSDKTLNLYLSNIYLIMIMLYDHDEPLILEHTVLAPVLSLM